MTRASLRCAGLCGLAFLAANGCGDTGQSRIELPIYGRGAPLAGAFEVDGFQVQLDRAEVGLGPIYVCASARSGSELCPSAVAEFADGASVDALDPSRQRLGELSALSQDARSVGMDYAITWPTSAARPVALPAAPGGHSAVFSGRVQRAERSFEFVAELDLAPLLRGTRAVQGLPTRVELEAGLALEIELDPVAWWSQVDFGELAMEPASERVELTEDSPAYRTVAAAMTSNATPIFRWAR
jgi:hypothetical protein